MLMSKIIRIMSCALSQPQFIKEKIPSFVTGASVESRAMRERRSDRHQQTLGDENHEIGI